MARRSLARNDRFLAGPTIRRAPNPRTGSERLAAATPRTTHARMSDGEIPGFRCSASISLATVISWCPFPEMDQLIPSLSTFVPQLRGTIMLFRMRATGRRQERAQEVNAAMIEFLRGL